MFGPGSVFQIAPETHASCLGELERPHPHTIGSAILSPGMLLRQGGRCRLRLEVGLFRSTISLDSSPGLVRGDRKIVSTKITVCQSLAPYRSRYGWLWHQEQPDPIYPVPCVHTRNQWDHASSGCSQNRKV